ncbi:MAG: protein translocase subunit SecD [Bacteroidetes bacterium]|jgi:SecD/SecF fusion protein|nr:protein translocase subunit SecD [Bacteroidota bacterium]
MKQKNLIFWLLAIFAAISLYNIYFTTERLGMEAEYEQQPDSTKAKWLQTHYDDYKGAVRKSLGLGLDLQGGIYITMEIGIDELIRAKAGNNVDETFDKAIESARKLQASQDAGFVDIFIRELRKLKPGVKLAAYFGGQNLSYNTPDAQVIESIRADANAAIDNALIVLRKRVDQFGVSSANIQKVTGTNRIVIELPGERDIARVRKLLKNTAQLEFWPVRSFSEVQPLLAQIDQATRGAVADDTLKQEKQTETAAAKPETAAADTKTAKTQAAAKQPKGLSDYLTMPQAAGPDPRYLGIVEEADTAKVGKLLRSAVVKNLVQSQSLRFAWSAKPSEGTESAYELYALYIFSAKGKSTVRGENIVDTRTGQDQNNQYMVSMSMDGEGAREWAKLTGEYKGKSIAVVLDQLVYSAPNVIDQITGGNSQITGNFSLEEATDLANILKAGKLPAPARIVGEEVVGPSLGKQTVDAGLFSFIAGFIAVILFVVAYYRRAGLVASVALVVNLIFLVGMSAALNVVMTLPGIAGIVLTMGMAVDANVLIYERIREELAEGRGLKGSINAGFQNALSSIVDGNLTTFLTGLILFIFGTGPIQGFAVTLMIGIFTTMVSGLLVTRLLLDYMTRKPDAKPMSFGSLAATRLFARAKLQVMKNRRISYTLVLLITLGSVVSIYTLGFRLGVDFKGGRQYVVQLDTPVTPEVVNDLRGSLTKGYGGEQPQIKAISGQNKVMITTAYLVEDPDADARVEKATLTTISQAYGEKANPQILRSNKVGPTVAKDIKDAAQQSVFFALLVMFIYILVRFNLWQYGMGALVSLTFNVIFVLGVFSLLGQIDNLPFSVEVDLTFIAAILTIVGYTINDTVIVFDRIRERIKEEGMRGDLTLLFNQAVNDTLSRTIVTSTTTLLSAFILFLFAGEVLQGFMLAMILGILIGTISSIFVASPISLDLIKRSMQRSAARQAAPAKVR